ncbi:hypothetical protein ABH923_003452 [Leifsonia sp. EB41]|uniref:hypothetical protein n=1 Tax=Leifsonia sp. EB41 TaxID=3156260 RepID=UPI0035199A3A
MTTLTAHRPRLMLRIVAVSPLRKVVSYPPYLTGVRADGFAIEFTIGENYSDFVGYSRCAPIDPDDPTLPKNW